jgi:multicomponent Na+:H+ antiporter subunit D
MFSLYGQTMDTVLVGWVIIALGVLSMFVGVTQALVQRDLKRFIGYAAVSQTGYMLLAIGVALATLGETDADLAAAGLSALTGGIFHIVNEIFTMGLLFLAAGAVYYRSGTRKLNEMGGLAHQMGWTSVFFLIGGLALSGIPPFNGFASKWIIYESVFRFNPILAAIGMAVSLITMAAFVKVFYAVFMGPPMKKFEGVTDVPNTMLYAMGALTLIIVLIGLFPNTVVSYVIRPAAVALQNQGGYLNKIMLAMGGA